MHAARNYGAVLQTYALQRYLISHGARVEIIDYKRKDQELVGYLFNVNSKFRNNKIMSLLFILKTFVPKLCTSCLFSKFIHKYLNLSKPVKNARGVQEMIKADIYCTGSDQVWNPYANSGLDPMYFLIGISPKVSYASSIGVYTMDDNYLEELLNLLHGYRAISIREQSSLNIIRSLEIEAECVLDPSFLLTKDEWNSFGKVKNNLPGNYLLIYYFGNTSSIMKIAEQIAKDKNLRIVRISVGFESYCEDDIVLRYPRPEEFVGLFSKATFVLTNSFHGTAFSINYNVDFLVYPTTEKNARFDSILDMFSLQSRNLRLTSNSIEASRMLIDWAQVNIILDQRRQTSFSFIKYNILMHQ